MGLNIQQGLTASGGGLTTDSQQPTSDVTAVTSTGFSGCKVVSIWFAFTHNNASAAVYAIEGRVSGGTWRTIANVTALADSQSAIGGYVTIANFNQATEKLVSVLLYTSAVVLDDSSATNNVGTDATTSLAYVAFNEVWDEVRINSDTASSIEGSTADQRGRWYVAGQA